MKKSDNSYWQMAIVCIVAIVGITMMFFIGRGGTIGSSAASTSALSTQETASDEANLLGGAVNTPLSRCYQECRDKYLYDPNPCGNGKIDSGEECDGTNLNGKNCESFGFKYGTLSCSGCKLVKSKCFNEDTCGNEELDDGEQCDIIGGRKFYGGETCKTKGFALGLLDCVNCKISTSKCTNCGNGKIDSGEECDGTDLNGKSCLTYGYYSGSLSCSSTCKLINSCKAVCNNGKIEKGEDCDGANLNGKSCASLGYTSGSLGCSRTTCKFYTTNCVSVCNNGKLEAGEQCDGENLNRKTCTSLGFSSGSLTCNKNTCQFDTTNCISKPVIPKRYEPEPE